MRFALLLALASTLAHATEAEEVFRRLGVDSVQIDLSSSCLVENATMADCQGLVLDTRYYHSRKTSIVLRGKGVPVKAIHSITT